MRRRNARPPIPRSLAALLLAAAPVLATTAAAPEEAVVAPELIRIEGRETTAGLLCCPRFARADHALLVTRGGELHHTILVREGLTDQEPARAIFLRDRLTGAELDTLHRLLVAARIGQQRDCRALGGFVFPESSAFGNRRLTWTGATGRRRSFATWRGEPCSPEVQAVIGYLRSLAGAAFTAPE